MSMTDPIADFLTRIRNGIIIDKVRVDIPLSKMKKDIARIMKDEGYIKNFKLIEDDRQGILRLYLKYDQEGNSVIRGLKRASKPGLRIYSKRDKIPRVLNGLGVALLSTSKGIMTNKEAERVGLGGEVLCYIW